MSGVAVQRSAWRSISRDRTFRPHALSRSLSCFAPKMTQADEICKRKPRCRIFVRPLSAEEVHELVYQRARCSDWRNNSASNARADSLTVKLLDGNGDSSSNRAAASIEQGEHAVFVDAVEHLALFALQQKIGHEVL